MKKFFLAFLSVAFLSVVGSAFAGDGWNLKLGMDVRARYDATNNLPTDKYGESGNSDYMRLRTRVSAKASYGDDFAVVLRLANEFRDYHNPKSNSSKQRFPDVLFIDNAYIDLKNVADCLDIRLGRQDMAFGAKRIIADGTGGDGSRSAYFDALRVTWHASEGRTLDAFALYMRHEDWLPTAGKEHANGKRPSDYDVTGYNQDEYGAGLYWQDRSNKSFGWDAYYVAKVEHRQDDSKYRSEGRNSETHTFGVRLLPKFSEKFSGEFEAALQAGSNSLFAGQLYGGLSYTPSKGNSATVACLYLSGDEEGPRGKHAWHQVFNRETGVGEAVAPMYTKYNYTNLLYPHLAGTLDLGRAGSLKVQAGPMFAPKEEQGHDSTRGLYAQAKWSVGLEKLLQAKAAKNLTFALTGEVLRKGNYFNKGSRGTALFSRAELAWKF